LIVIVACGALVWAMFKVGRIQFGLVAFAVASMVAVIKGFVTTGSKFKGIPGSVQVTEEEQPELFRVVGEVADAMNAHRPDEVYLVHDVNAFVLEDTRLLGLITRKRVMGIGLALMNTFTVDEMRGVIAHEFGHYAGGDTRLAPLVYRGRESIFRTLKNLGGGILRNIYIAYFKLFLRTSMSVSRNQELAADEWSVRIAGSEPTIATHRRLGANGLAYDAFLGRYVQPLWRSGFRPVNQFDGFRQMVEHNGNALALAETAKVVLGRSSSEFDSHPAAAERIAFIQSLPSVSAVGDSRLARELLLESDRLEAAVTTQLQLAASSGAPLQPVTWDQAAPVLAERFATAARTLRDITMTTSASAALASTIPAIENGRVSLSMKIARGLGTQSDPQGALHAAVAASLGEVFVERGTHAWAVSWTSPLGVEPLGDAPAVDVWELARALIELDPTAVERAMRLGVEIARDHLKASIDSSSDAFVAEP
jgi:Zn-dependent protease with chaperone function